MTDELIYEELVQRIAELKKNEHQQPEEAMRESDQRFHRFAENSPDMIYRMSLPDGKYEYISPASTTIFGYSPKEWYDNPLLIRRIIHEDFNSYFEQQWEDLRKGFISPTYEYKIIHKDGTIRWVNQRNILIKDDDGLSVAIEGVVTDITERKLNEDALRQSEKKLQDTLDATPFPVAVVDLDDDSIFFWSRSALELFGHTAPTASEWYQIAYPDPNYRQEVIERWKPFLEKARESNQPVNTGEYRVTCKDGSERICELYATFIPGNLIVTFQDITERKRAQDAINAANKLLQTIINTAPIRIFFKDRDLRYLGCNTSFARDAGAERAEDLIGKDDFELVWKDQAELYRADDLNVIESGVPKLSYDEPQTTPEGKQIWLRTSKVPLRDGKDTIIGVLGMYEDITEHKQIESAIHREKCFTEAIFESIPGILYVYDDQAKLVRWNKKHETMTGYSAEELAQMTSPDWHPEEERAEVAKAVEAVMTTGYGMVEAHLLTKDGKNPLMQLNGIRLNLEGKTYFVGIGIDITERKRSEKELQNRAEDLRESQRIAHVGSWRLDISSNEVTWSDELYNMYGFDPSLPPPPYNEHHKIFTPESWNRLSKALPKTIEAGIPYELELETMREDGGIGWMWVRGEAILDAKGAISGLRGAAQDITERKFIENALKESKTFLDNLNDIAYMADTEGNVSWVNAAIEKIAGFPPEEVIGKSFLPLFVKEDHVSLIDVYKRTLGGESLANKLTFTSGKTCYFTSLPRRNITGDIVGTFGIARDITESQRAEEALRESEDRLRKAQEVAKIGSWEYDISTGKVWGSEEAFRIYGIERKTEFLPLDEVESSILDVKKVNQALVDLITKNEGYDIEFEISPKNREGIIVIRSIAELVYDANGNPGKVLGVIQDITNAKAEEDERIKLLGQLQQAQKMESVGRLAGGVAHDFNNMLGVILGHAEMIMEQLDPALPIYTDLEEIRKAAQRSAGLTRQLLAFARKQTMAPRVLDLNQILEGMLQMLRRLIGEDIDLAWRPGKDLAPVNMDPSQLDQMLVNLCVNSRDAIADVGKITIETGTAVFNDDYCSEHVGFVPGEFVLLAVSDDGCGMDQETQIQIFEPFFTTKEQGKGTGLGLATVYGIVKQNNGFINVYSEPDQGTTFRIYLPRHIGKPVQIREEGPAKPDTGGHETILLVEDEPTILRMTTTMLERLGYTVVAANTPAEAIRLAGEYAGYINLLMTDVVMPEMNGRDLAKNLLLLYPNLKRLFMSGYTANVIAHHGVLDKGVNFIQKPFSKKDLAVKVNEALNSVSE